MRDSLERVRGSVELTTEPGHGTTLILECPLSLAVVRAVLVGVGPHLFAVPTLAVERLLRVRADAVRSAEGRAVVPGEGAPVPLVSLARLLGPPLADRPVERVVRGVVMASGERRVALSVDRLEAEEELVLRPLPHGARSGPFAGAAVLGSGALALVLDTHAILNAALEGRTAASPEVAGPESTPAHRILVADDSLTTRSLEQSVLEAAGYLVTTAVDGLDALRQLQAEPFDLVVSDVEMPRMDGFALCESIRSSPRLRETPVVLVTALESEQDRARGLEAGADAYLPKSSFDQQTLLDTIHHLLD
ncbi:MAG TPA: response regulator [Longimicrobiaceae bacterium]|nr:response regulator [Longimicrobiaceae bacterium]